MVSDESSLVLIALGCACLVAVLTLIAELLHAKRVARVTRLAFGPEGKPARWTVVAPLVRIFGLSLATLGAVLLFNFDPIEADDTPNARASRQLLVVLDVSPSMNLADSGPRGTSATGERMMRGVWAGKVLQGILDRIDMSDTRISLIAFYTKALPILQDCTDKSLLPSIMDGLPLYTAFKPGETDLQAGIDAAFAMAKGWARNSTTLVVISDGDLTKPVHPRGKPASIADVIVIGVGDPSRAMVLSGHSSRQDQWELKSIAAKLDGYYHEGNTRHLPREVIDGLTMIAPRVSDVLSAREIGLISLGLGAISLGLLTPLLLRFGTPRSYAVALRESSISIATPSTSTTASRTSLEGTTA